MSLPVVFKNTSLARAIADNPARAAAIGVPVALVGIWLLPWWVLAAPVAYGGWKVWERTQR